MSERDQNNAEDAVSAICQKKYGTLHTATAKQKYATYLVILFLEFVIKIYPPSPKLVTALMSAEILK